MEKDWSDIKGYLCQSKNVEADVVMVFYAVKEVEDLRAIILERFRSASVYPKLFEGVTFENIHPCCGVMIRWLLEPVGRN